MLGAPGVGMSVECDTPTGEAAPRCENGMLFVKEARTRVTRVADQACTWCVQAWYPCCRDCRCDPFDVFILCLVCASVDD